MGKRRKKGRREWVKRRSGVGGIRARVMRRRIMIIVRGRIRRMERIRVRIVRMVRMMNVRIWIGIRNKRRRRGRGD